MEITGQLIKELREVTGAGILDCKKALETSKGDIEKAILILKETGTIKAAKKSERISADGLCEAVIKGNDLVLFELNSETDFVAKNEKFLALINTLGKVLIENPHLITCEDALLHKHGKISVKDIIVEHIQTIGEKISLRRIQRIKKKDSELFGVYKHNGGKIVVAVVIDKKLPEVAEDIAMHIAANSPKYLSKDSIDPKTKEEEARILKDLTLKENAESDKPKPDVVIAKIIEGRVSKFFQEYTLLDQSFVKDDSITVSQYLNKFQAKVISYARFEVGEGMEKRVNDFVSEVNSQIK